MSEAAPTGRPLALVADDDPTIRELVLIRLERLGYTVMAARDGAEALQLARERPPELAVLDVAMPALDGLEVARRLGESLETREIPLIFLSARVAEADVARGYEAGGAEYIKKPFSPRELTEAVKRKQAELALRRAEAETRALAREQAALHRVAAAVARGEGGEAMFALVAEEVAALLEVENGLVVRFEDDDATVLGYWRSPAHPNPQSPRPRLLSRGAVWGVRESGEPSRVDLPAGEPGLRSRVAAPVWIEKGLWGAVAVASSEPARLPADAAARLGRFADLLALAVTNAEAHTQLARQARDETGLRRIATLVASEAEPRAVFHAVANEAAEVLGADRGTVVRFEDDGRLGQVVGTWSRHAAPGGAPPDRLVLSGSGPVARVAQTGQAARTDDLSALRGADRSALPAELYRSAAAVPIRGGPGLWGAVAVASWAPLPRAADVRLSRFGELVGLGLSNADARAQLAELASTDELTGLPNQRSFNEFVAVEIERARRHGRPLSLVLFDLDHFKLVNDTHGHPVGDRVLAEAARRLGRLARAQDTVARVGGEEFAWVLPETDGAGALQAAERAREAIGGAPFPVAGPLTVSAGLCELEAAGPAAAAPDLFRLADVALYRAKQAGRNRCERHLAGAADTIATGDRESARARALAGMLALVRATEAEGDAPRSHSERVAQVAERLALALGWPAERARALREAGRLHDVGKVAVRERVLHKAGPLDPLEHEEVQAHVTLGAQLLGNLLDPDQVGWVRHHHERYDGNGYPDGMSGDDIPHGARLLGLAEAWDAMTAERSYARALTIEEALGECRGLAGRQFAPADVAALERLVAEGQREPL